MKLLLLLPPLAALSLWATPQEDPAQAPGPKIGKAAPVIRLNDETGAIREVGPNEDGLWTVLAFYPKAATPG